MIEWIKKVIGAKTNPSPDDQVKSFKTSQAREEAYDRIDRGVHTVPLNMITGSVGRYQDFDGAFRLKQHVPSERLNYIKNAMRSGKPLPPVRLFKIKEEYYVLDGNHRIAAANAFGHDEITAQILEFLPAAKTIENVIYLEKVAFEDATGLKLDSNLTEPGQYAQLIDQIRVHQQFLSQRNDQAIDLPSAARDWQLTIYEPLVMIIKKGGLIDHFPDRTLGDLYVYISNHQWQNGKEKRRYGIGLNRLVPRDMEAFREKMAHTDECDYPEMVREVTAFILMTVEGKKEARVLEKLDKMDEISEIHSVHGSFDILLKVVLRRDLLASDAETIGEFVHSRVRQVPGVITTQTLIPSFSRVR
jgi:DNA-binding Lrp family transcriptional regulator